MHTTSVQYTFEPSSYLPLEHAVTWCRRKDGGDALEPPVEAADPLVQGCSVVICTYKRAASLSRLLDSLLAQSRKPDQLIIVDASPDEETEQVVRNHQYIENLANKLLYFRVSGPLKGLTRQRNFALRWVNSDLVTFFDDDIILLPDCLRNMENSHRLLGDQVMGVGAFIQNQDLSWPLVLSWRIHLLLRMVPELQPGRYYRSGISTSWSFLSPTEELVEGDWLPGCAMMWKTAVAREVGFYDGFYGYAKGEDLDFSLRARRKGKLVMAGAARVLHLTDPDGRPDPFRLGYMEIYNKYYIHQRAILDRTPRDTAWFIYAWTLETLLLARHLLLPSRWVSTFRQMAGRLKAAYDIMRGR
jgi:GT2 family glycosyltransferase